LCIIIIIIIISSRFIGRDYDGLQTSRAAGGKGAKELSQNCGRDQEAAAAEI
jgi:hypothetical protein